MVQDSQRSSLKATGFHPGHFQNCFQSCAVAAEALRPERTIGGDSVDLPTRTQDASDPKDEARVSRATHGPCLRDK